MSLSNIWKDKGWEFSELMKATNLQILEYQHPEPDK